jgi:RNA polymerase sigma-70 factor (ECF subfamily)
VSDEELLRAWAEGDRGAGERLFERHFESVVRFFRNKAAGDHEDLIQQTFLGCVEALPRFRREASFRTFLFSVARNVLGKHYRTRRRNLARLDFGSVSVQDLQDSPSAVFARDQAQRHVLMALRRINVDAQIALELHYWEAMTAAEIAEVLAIPLGTAKTRLRRAKQLLQAELERIRGVSSAAAK